MYKMFVESGDVYGKQMGKTGFGKRMTKLLSGCGSNNGLGQGQQRPRLQGSKVL